MLSTTEGQKDKNLLLEPLPISRVALCVNIFLGTIYVDGRFLSSSILSPGQQFRDCSAYHVHSANDFFVQPVSFFMIIIWVPSGIRDNPRSAPWNMPLKTLTHKAALNILFILILSPHFY